MFRIKVLIYLQLPVLLLQCFYTCTFTGSKEKVSWAFQIFIELFLLWNVSHKANIQFPFVSLTTKLFFLLLLLFLFFLFFPAIRPLSMSYSFDLSGKKCYSTWRDNCDDCKKCSIPFVCFNFHLREKPEDLVPNSD